MKQVHLKEDYLRAETFLKSEKGSDEVTTLIHRTPWVRILLEHDREEGDFFFIEVEMSIPESSGNDDVDPSEVIDKLSEHLRYLQQLRDHGFELSVIDSGGIYCASRKIHDTPEDNLFSALLPPMTE